MILKMISVYSLLIITYWETKVSLQLNISKVRVCQRRTTKKELESAIHEVMESLSTVAEDDKSLLLKKQDLQKEIIEAKEGLVKIPEQAEKEQLTSDELKSAILSAISSLEPVHTADKKHTFSKQELELAIKDAKVGLIEVTEKEKRHALQKQDLQTEIRDAKVGLKRVAEEEKRHALQKKATKIQIQDKKTKLKSISEEVKRPHLSTKQLRTSIKDARTQLEPVSSDIKSITSFSLGESIKEEGEKIRRELLPIPGDVEVFEVTDLNHIKEYVSDKQDFCYVLNHLLKEKKKPSLKITINSRTLFNRIELIDEKDPVSVDNLIAGGDLVQFGQAYRFLLKFGYIRIK